MDLSFLEYPFMIRALITGGALGIVCGVIGVFVILRGAAFVAEGVSHAAFAGIALGILLGISPILSAFVFCMFVAMSIAYVSYRSEIKEDTGSGIFLSASLALGMLLMTEVKGRSIDVVGLLFGSILSISSNEAYLSLALCAAVLLFIILFYKEMVALVFDEEWAWLLGIPVRMFTYLLFAGIAIAVIASVRLVGSVLVTALILTPPATALQLSQDIGKVIWISAGIGFLSCEVGLVLSYYLDTPPGATIALLATLSFLSSLLVRKKA